MSIFVIANKFTSAKTLTAYYLAKYESSFDKKVLIFNFDENSIFKRIFKNWKKFYLSNSQNKSNILANIMRGPSFDLINIFFNLENHTLSKEEIHEKLNNIINVISENYHTIIIDLTSTTSAFNNFFIANKFNILVPIVLNYENQIEYFSQFLYESDVYKYNINFFVVSFDKSNNNHIFNVIKYKKELSTFLLNNFVTFFKSTDATLIFNKKEVEDEYKNIFKELKIV